MNTITIQPLDDLEELVLKWGLDKGILPNPDKFAQFTKTLEEVSELGAAIQANDREAAVDAIGDIIVTLIMQCQAWDSFLSEGLSTAYATISARTGKMVDGVFVKDED